MFLRDNSTWRWPWPWRSTEGYEAINLEAVESAVTPEEAQVRVTKSERWHTPWVASIAVASLLLGVLVGAICVRLRASAAAAPVFFAPVPASNLSSALGFYTARQKNAPSSRWAPMVIASCTPNMHPYHAPCLAMREDKVAYGEELVYPDFRIREPIFASSRRRSDRPYWRSLLVKIRERASICQEEFWACYRGISGQNIIVVNSTYVGIPVPDSWTDQNCMGERVSIKGLKFDPKAARLDQADYDKQFPTDRLIIAASPDSWSFQHFLDRVTHILAQGAHLNQGLHPEVAIGRRPVASVQQMWDMLGYKTADDMHFSSKHVAAKSILFSCRTPLIHPYLSFRSLEAFGVVEPRVPLKKRKKVIYCSRSTGKGIVNGGRKVLNEPELLDAIRGLLVERNQGEELVVFNQDAYGGQRQLMQWFHNNVRAIIGPHGGALFNHRWTGADTLVLEMMPTSFTSMMFWEEASILGQVYANMILKANGTNTNFETDVPAVLEILREHLGKPDKRGPAVDIDYRWYGAELQGR